MHPKMPPEIVKSYRAIEGENLEFAETDDVIPLLARADAGAAVQLLADLADIEIGELPSDSLVEQGTVAASLDGDPLASGTDFLLTLELPAWDQAGERKSL